jgi:methylenetetrahydrofolate dehydrogenase (NADP+)/methenyltetrahydrofolate cyclohydrolase
MKSWIWGRNSAGLFLAGRAEERRRQMEIIDGKKISQEIKEELREKAAEQKSRGEERCLAVIQVGSDPASTVYVRNKKKACEYIGIKSISYELPEETGEEELLEIIRGLNEREDVNGILVQLPLPEHINEERVLSTIAPKKDVDGFHPVSVGNLSIGRPGYVSCTPAGVIQLLKRSGIEIEGKECVVLGRSNIVGKPMAMLLLRENGTVTVCHSRTKNLKEITRRADILVVAVGRPKFVDADFVKEGAVVIDVGIHRNPGGKLCGDVDFDNVAPKASAITPVPGGVGPMTIAMLMANCVNGIGG